MSYEMSFRGELQFASAQHIEMGLDGLFATCHDEHMISLESINLVAPARIELDYECSTVAEAWYNLLSALRIMAELACDGELIASFHGDSTNVELIRHGGHTRSLNSYKMHHIWEAHFALRADELNTLEKLLKAGLAVNEITPFEDTPGSTTLLWEAVDHDNKEAIAMLLSAGASHDWRRWHAPILSATQSVAAQELLLKAGAVVDSACFERGWWEEEAPLLNLLNHAPANLSEEACHQVSLNAALHAMHTTLKTLHQRGLLKLSTQELEEVYEQLEEHQDHEALKRWLMSHT